MVLVVKNLPTNARDVRVMDLIPGSGRSPGGEYGNPLHYSFKKVMYLFGHLLQLKAYILTLPTINLFH